MDLTPYQQSLLQELSENAVGHMETMQKEAKTANDLRIILIVVQGVCWALVVYFVALYVFRVAP